MAEIKQLQEQITQQIEGASSLAALEEVRVANLGKTGVITQMMKELGKLSGEERKEQGQILNAFKNAVVEKLEDKKNKLEAAALEAELSGQKIDITLPVRPEVHQGRIHPVYQAMDEMMTIFAQMGFELAEGPDIEDDWHNFEALNIPKNHPARQMQDSFYFANGNLLRTHTSGVQIRTMEKHRPPIKVVCPGRTYRVDNDATHTPMFHQIEGLMVDKTTNLANLYSVLLEFMKLFFETDDVALRFRPSFFPFTEPSFEMDVGGKLAHAIGKEWLELGGCGMVDPVVLENCHIDPKEYQGFAFGFGIDRCAMMKYNIPDLRIMFDGDMRWIKHYGFTPIDVPTLTAGLSGNGGKKC